jgi:membrane protease subunit HflK
MNESETTFSDPPALRLTRRLYLLCAFALATAYLTSGVTTVEPGHVALVFRFGRLVSDEERPIIHRPGLLIAWPEPIDRVVRVAVEREQVVELKLGARAAGSADQAPAAAADECFLTGDGNLAECNLRVKYRITDPSQYVVNCADVSTLLAAAIAASATAQSAETSLDDLLRLRRTGAGEIVSVTEQIQAAIAARLSRTPCGIAVTAVEVSSVRPPAEVVEAFDEVQTARIEQDTRRQRVIGERDETLIEAEALVQQTIADARGALVSRRAEAEAAAAHFEADLSSHHADPATARARLLREAWNRVLAGGAKVYFLDGAQDGAQLRLSVGPPQVRP